MYIDLDMSEITAVETNNLSSIAEIGRIDRCDKVMWRNVITKDGIVL